MDYKFTLILVIVASMNIQVVAAIMSADLSGSEYGKITNRAIRVNIASVIAFALYEAINAYA